MYALLLTFVTVPFATACTSSSHSGARDAGDSNPNLTLIAPGADAGVCPSTGFVVQDSGAVDCGYGIEPGFPDAFGPGDAGTCESRTPAPCNGGCAARTLDEQISVIVGSCNGFRMESTVNIAL